MGSLPRWMTAVAAGWLAACSGAPAGAPPNVVLLVLDTVRRDHLSAYGYARDTSPALAALARESLLFDAAVAAAPWTLPSHGSLFTGLPPSGHGAHHEHLALDPGHRTLAQRLAAHGYQTAGFCNNPWITEVTGMARGFEHFVEVWRSQVSRDTFALNLFTDTARHGFDDAGAAHTLDAIRDWLEGRDPSRPFFLFVNLVEAHSVYDPPAPYRNLWSRGAPLTPPQVRALNLKYPRLAHADRLSRPVLARARTLYDGEISYVDAWLAKFVELLRERDLLDPSLLVITSDHGEAFGERRRCGIPLVDHQLNVHEEVLAIPLLVRLPGDRGRSGRVAAPVSQLDVVPTVLDVVGIESGGALPGVSLADEVPAERVITSEYFRPRSHRGYLEAYIDDEERIACLVERRVAVARSGHLKLVVSTDGGAALYDLRDDPKEERPLPPEAAADLHAAALEVLQRMEASVGAEGVPSLDADQRDALRAMGYLR